MHSKQYLGLVLLILLSCINAPLTMASNDWYAEYFSNRDLAGTPALTRHEPALHFEWGGGSPGAAIPADNFSARFSHEEWFEGGTYRFSYRADDGVRLWVDNALILDAWSDQQASWHFLDHYIARGTHHVRVEYYEHGGGAALQIAWSKASAGAMWRADYFANQDLAGDPALVRDEVAIDFDWGTESPAVVIPNDHFSARWSRTLGFEAGTYRFYASCDDGVRISVDGHRVLDVWKTQPLPNTQSGDIVLNAGQHTVVVEYFEQGGDASAHVWWKRLDTLDGWEGRYYDNRQLRGGPALIRDDAEINFDWGEGAPVTWMPSDDFSVAWTRQINFKPGLYRFNVRADDGFRLWIDELDLRMDFWQPQDFEWRYQDWHYLEGMHTLKLEYFEAAGNARVQLWWDYAATIAAAQAMPPSSHYGFAAAPLPLTSTPTPSAPGLAQPSAAPAANLPGPWQGEYFNGRDMTKSPVLTRTDPIIDFNWGWGSPSPDIPANQFAARWTGTFNFEAGHYRFTTTSDDGVRIYIDDALVLDSWHPMRGTRYATVHLERGQHIVRVDYFEAMQAAKVRINWKRVVSIPTPPSPPTPATALTATWTAHYYTNRALAGEPAMVNVYKGPLDFDWGFEAPDEAMPKDNFAAAFEAQVNFKTGRYRFSTTSDDGVRLYIDDKRVINSWYPMRGTRTATVTLAEGKHTFRLEYFERAGAANVQLYVQSRD